MLIPRGHFGPGARMRLFVALDLPELTPPASSLRAPERHLTLRFLGEMAPAQVPVLEGAILRAASDFEEFRLAIGGGGAFPRADRPRVVWAGIREGRARLVELERRLSFELGQIGIPAGSKPFVPHVTILRVRGPREGAIALRLLAELETAELGATTVHEITLYESRLRPEGAEHRPLVRAPLRRSEAGAASAPAK